MEPILPITPPAADPPPAEDPAPTLPPPAEPLRLGGIHRSMATIGLAVGLLAVGGVAAVMAASPEPSTGASPTIETPSTQPPATDDDPSTSTDRKDRGDCPEDADGTSGGSDSGTDDSGTSPSTAPSTTPSEVPEV